MATFGNNFSHVKWEAVGVWENRCVALLADRLIGLTGAPHCFWYGQTITGTARPYLAVPDAAPLAHVTFV